MRSTASQRQAPLAVRQPPTSVTAAVRQPRTWATPHQAPSGQLCDLQRAQPRGDAEQRHRQRQQHSSSRPMSAPAHRGRAALTPRSTCLSGPATPSASGSPAAVNVGNTTPGPNGTLATANALNGSATPSGVSSPATANVGSGSSPATASVGSTTPAPSGRLCDLQRAQPRRDAKQRSPSTPSSRQCRHRHTRGERHLRHGRRAQRLGDTERQR